MTISKRIREIRRQKNLSQTEFSKVLGVKQATISQYESGIHAPGRDFIKNLASIYNLDLNWLINGPGSEPLYNEPARARDPSATLQVPIVADIAAGMGIDAIEGEPEGTLAISRHLVPSAQSLLAFRVRGDSMLPFICPGDYAVINTNWFDYALEGFITACRLIRIDSAYSYTLIFIIFVSTSPPYHFGTNNLGNTGFSRSPVIPPWNTGFSRSDRRIHPAHSRAPKVRVIPNEREESSPLPVHHSGAERRNTATQSSFHLRHLRNLRELKTGLNSPNSTLRYYRIIPRPQNPACQNT